DSQAARNLALRLRCRAPPGALRSGSLRSGYGYSLLCDHVLLQERKVFTFSAVCIFFFGKTAISVLTSFGNELSFRLSVQGFFESPRESHADRGVIEPSQ